MVRESPTLWISWKCSCPLAEELRPNNRRRRLLTPRSVRKAWVISPCLRTGFETPEHHLLRSEFGLLSSFALHRDALAVLSPAHPCVPSSPCCVPLPRELPRPSPDPLGRVHGPAVRWESPDSRASRWETHGERCVLSLQFYAI